MNLAQLVPPADSPIAGVPVIVIVAVGGLLALSAGALLRLVVMDIRHHRIDGSDALHSGRLAIFLTIVWTMVSFTVLVSLGMFDFELFLTLSIIGFLVAEFLMSPTQSSERWSSRFRLLRVPALLAFAYIIFQRVMAVV